MSKAALDIEYFHHQEISIGQPYSEELPGRHMGGNEAETGDAGPTEETQNVQSEMYHIEKSVTVGCQRREYNFMGTLVCLDIHSEEQKLRETN